MAHFARHEQYQNLEIILVDDGSPDCCGAICDAYAGKDSRIKVIHKENGGLSSARNTGIELANGIWLGFVDSDDWIEPEMYQSLLEAAITWRADVVTCGCIAEWLSTSIAENRSRCQILHGQKEIAKAYFVDDTLKTAAWRRLYSRSLFTDGLRFVEGRNFEDTPFVCEILLRSNNMVILKENYYHWRKRKNSIAHTRTLKNTVDFWKSVRDQYEMLEQELPEYHRELMIKCCGAALRVWLSMAAAVEKERTDFTSTAEEIQSFARTHRREILSGRYRVRDKFIVYMVSAGGGWSYWAVKAAWEIYHVLSGKRREEKRRNCFCD